MVLRDTEHTLRSFVVEESRDPPDLRDASQERAIALHDFSVSRLRHQRSANTYSECNVLHAPPVNEFRDRGFTCIDGIDLVVYGGNIAGGIVHICALNRFQTERQPLVCIMTYRRIEQVRVIAALLQDPVIARQIVLEQVNGGY